MKKEIEKLHLEQANMLQERLLLNVEIINGISFLAAKVDIPDMKILKSLAYNLQKEIARSVIVLATIIDEKPQLLVVIDEKLTKSTNLHAGIIIKEIAVAINGGGGGQPFFATAGGTDVSGIDKALAKATSIILQLNVA